MRAPVITSEMLGDGIGWCNLLDWVDPYDYLARDDTVTDNTTAIQNAINNAANKVLYFPYRDTGVYMTHLLTLIDDIILFFAPGVEIRLIANSNTRMFEVFDTDNVEFWGGTINGNRAAQTPTGSEHCLDFRGCNRVVVRGTQCINSSGDGIVISATPTNPYCEDVIIDGVVCDNNYRQGLSLISGKNVDIIKSGFRNTNGTTPGYGIDIEPNANTNILQGVRVSHCTSLNNFGFGFGIGTLVNLAGSTVEHDVTISDCTSYADFCGFGTNKATGAFEMNISFHNCKAIASKHGGFLFHAPDQPRIEAHDCEVLNCNTLGGANVPWDSGFSIFCEGGDGLATMKNVHLFNCTAEDLNANMPRGFCISRSAAEVITGITMINCRSIGHTAATGFFLHPTTFEKDTNVLEGYVGWDPGAILDGNELAQNITINNAKMGDFVHASFSLDVQDLQLTADVTAADTVTCLLNNNTGGTIDLGSGIVYAKVITA